jgi:hypothetical protein
VGALKVWDGTAWQIAAGGGGGVTTYVGPSAPPGTPASGDLWYDTDDVSGLVFPIAVAQGGTGGTSPTMARSSLSVPYVGNSLAVVGAPTTGTYVRGDTWIDSTGAFWTCTAAGSPGTWTLRPRTYVTSVNHLGPFNGSYPFSAPFKCDIGCMVGMSWYSSTTGLSSHTPRIDGADVSNSVGMYFNEAATHKTVNGAFALRAVAAGTHTITYRVTNANSDSGDVANWAMTMVEVP